MSGKGDKNRTKDYKKFNDNFDLIFKNKSKRDREKKVNPPTK